MHFSTVAFLLLASKAFAAPLQQRDVAVDIVDVTVTQMTTVTVGDASTPAAFVEATSTSTHHHHHSHHTHPSHTDDGDIWVTVTSVWGNYGAPVETPSSTSAPDVVVITYTQGYEQPSSTPEPVYVQPTTTEVAAPPASSAPAPPSSTPAAPAYTAPASTNTGDSLAAGIVDRHNLLRAAHGVPPVQWNTTLADYAANNMPECVMAHTQPYKYGENLAFGYSDTVKAVQDWYNEINQYNYADATFGETTGHFTQVVWKDTTDIGCHYIESCGYLKCEYWTPGNFLGEFTQNVLPALKNMVTSS